MSVIKQPFQMLPFSPSIESQWRLRSDCYNDICDIPIIPKGKFVPFAIISDSDNIGTITIHCHDEPFSYIRTENFTRDNCETGSGSTVSFSKIYYSTISNLDAQQKAMDDPLYLIEGQEYANLNGECTSIGNTEQSQIFNRSNCAEDYVGSEVTYTVLENTYYAGTLAEANQLALDDIAANGQAYADANGICLSRYLIDITYHNTETVGDNIFAGAIEMTGQSGSGGIEWNNVGGFSYGVAYDINANAGATIDITFNLDMLKSRDLIAGKTYRIAMDNTGSNSPAVTKTFFMAGIGIATPLIYGTKIEKDFIFNYESPLQFKIRFQILSNGTALSLHFFNITLKQLD